MRLDLLTLCDECVSALLDGVNADGVSADGCAHELDGNRSKLL
jgi:hypothetical protein